MSDAAPQTVNLRDAEAQLEAEFVPAAGMLCCSLRHRGEELLAQRAGVEAYAERGKTMGIPLLYPWANRLAGFDYRAAGRSVTVPHDPARVALDGNGLPIHGVIGGRVGWELTRAPAETGGQALAAQLRWDAARAELFEVFPFHHELHYEARIGESRLEVEIALHACGADAVPVAFGFHPYLSLPGEPRARWQVELPAMRRLALDANQIPSGPEQWLPTRSFALAELQFDDGFDSVDERARFRVQGTRRGIVLELLEGYRNAQVFAPAESQFICFEPMTAPANALRSGAGLQMVPAGERYRARFAVHVQALPAAG
jgi:aldose 1-epimerase